MFVTRIMFIVDRNMVRINRVEKNW